MPTYDSVLPPAGDAPARVTLTAVVFAAQLLTLPPGAVLGYLAGVLAAFSGPVVGVPLVALALSLFLALNYGVAFLATFLAERILRRATFFSPPRVARGTTLGLGAGLLVAGSAALVASLLSPDPNSGPTRVPARNTLEDVSVVAAALLVVSSSLAGTWKASRHHVDS